MTLTPYYQTALGTLYHGDCLDVMRELPDASVDAVVTDPPYELGFMGAKWDKTGIAYSVPMWAEVLRVLKPGGHCLAFGGTRTYHRMACAIEDAGFEVRDMIEWVYGSGFPKSLDVSKAIDKQCGIWRGRAGAPHLMDSKRSMGQHYVRSDKGSPHTLQAVKWHGWGTALKPAHEPVCVARKPLIGTVVDNVLTYGTGALNIDAGRVACEPWKRDGLRDDIRGGAFRDRNGKRIDLGPNESNPLGRWPANLIHDGSEDVLKGFPVTHGGTGIRGKGRRIFGQELDRMTGCVVGYDAPGGSAARFFYCAKASASERGAFNNHPTVKPKALIRYLVGLVLPPGGVVLDPFTGSGTLPVVAEMLGARWIGIEREAQWCDLIVKRLKQPKQRVMGGQ